METKKVNLKKVLALVSAIVLVVQFFVFVPAEDAKAAGNTYYVDNCVVTGNNSNNGTSPSTPWLTISKVNSWSFNPGDSILFQGGCTWRETLYVPSSGSAGNPITVGSYGTGQATINGSDILSSGWTQYVGSLSYNWTSEASGFNRDDSSGYTYVIKNGASTVASGSVTQANMKLSMATGAAFVDFNSAGTLTPYVGDQLIITDSSSHQLTGYISAAGTGQTYGSQLLSNTAFDTTSGITSIYASTIASVAGGQTGNALQVTTSAAYGNAVQSFTAPNGALLLSSGYMKKGTEASLEELGLENASFTAINQVYALPSSWTQYSFYATAQSATNYQLYLGASSGQTSLFDTASVTQVLTPSATGVTIVSTLGPANIWQHAFNPTLTEGESVAYAWVFFNGVAGGINGGNPSASIGAVTSANQWYWDGSSTLYVYSTSNPATAFTSPGIEATTRTGVKATNKSYVTFDNLNVKNTIQSCFDLYQLSHGVVKNSTTSYCGYNGIIFYNSNSSFNSSLSDYYTAANNVVTYSANVGIMGNMSNNGLIYNNDVSHSGVREDDSEAIGIYGNCNNNRIYNNYAHDNTDQTGPIGVRGIEDDTITSPGVNYVYNNLVASSNGSGIIVQSSANQYVYGNISYNNTTGVGGNAYVVGIEDAASTGVNYYYDNTTYNNQFAEMDVYNNSSFGPVIKNNIFYASVSSSGDINTNGSTPTLSVVDYNLVYGISNPYNWGGATYSTPSAFFTASGQGQHDIKSDPKFTTNGSNFSLLSTSPAIDVGTNLGSTYQLGLSSISAWPSSVTTLNQNSNGSGWDMGAYVYTQSTTPTVSLSAPSAGTLSGTTTTISATASATAPAAVSQVQFYLDGTTSLGTDTTSPYSIIWNTTTASNTSHTLLAVATDNYGNVATSSPAVTVTVDNAAPVVTPVSPSGTLAWGTTSAVLSVTTDENATCKYATSSGVSYASMANTFTTTGTTTHSSNLTGLISNHTYNYYVRCQDSHNNANNSDTTITFSIAADSTAPTVSITSPASGQTLSGTFTVSATATDNSAVSSVQFLLDGSNLGSAVTTAPYSVSWNTSQSNNGSHTLSAIATDDSGNTATAMNVSVNVSNGGGGGLPSAAYTPPQAPTGGFKVVINNGTNTTNNRKVNLTLVAGTDVKNMAISNTGDFSDAGQQAFVSSLVWDLCSAQNGYIVYPNCTAGTKTVSVKFFTSWGQPSAVVKASINYQPTSSSTNSNPANSSATVSNNNSPTAPTVNNTNPSSCQVPPNSYQFNKTLAYGSRGQSVIFLQDRLKALGLFPCTTKSNGIFGSSTLKAVQKFQIQYVIVKKNQSGYGQVGPKTRQALNSLNH
jgi:hypothetical protein